MITDENVRAMLNQTAGILDKTANILRSPVVDKNDVQETIEALAGIQIALSEAVAKRLLDS